jgi:hypothetical protein
MAKKVRRKFLNYQTIPKEFMDVEININLNCGLGFKKMFDNVMKKEHYVYLFRNCKEEYVDQVNDLIENCQFALLDQLLKTCVDD